MSDEQKNYIKLLLKNGDNLTTDSKIELSTIHGAKGRECKNVILYISRSKIKGSVVSHLGEVHLKKNSKGKIINLIN